MDEDQNTNQSSDIFDGNQFSPQFLVALKQFIASFVNALPPLPGDATKFLNGANPAAFTSVTDADLSTSDITTNNVSTSKHGFAPKLPNDASKFFNGAGAFTAPPGMTLVKGTDTASHTGTQVKHTITHGLGVTTKLICVTATFVATPPSGSNTNSGIATGNIVLDGSGNIIGGSYIALFTGSPTGAIAYVGTGAATGTIVGSSITTGGTGTSSITVNNVTSTTFDVVYDANSATLGRPQAFSINWYVTG